MNKIRKYQIMHKPLINPCVESIIDGSACRLMNDNESCDDEDREIPDFMELHSSELHASEKLPDYFEFLKYLLIIVMYLIKILLKTICFNG